MTLRVLDLRAENVVGLLGTEVRQPRLSWRLEDEGRGQAQAAFRIRAAHSAPALESGELLWDSGVIESDASLDLPYGGPPLEAMQRVWWSVEVQAADGAAAHSEAAWFEAGLLGPEDWRADWIEAEDESAAADRAAGLAWIWSETALDPRLHAFRMDFDAPKDVAGAEILLAGKDHLRGVWINGGQWAQYNNETFRSDSYNDWWHERPWRAYPRWVRSNQVRVASSSMATKNDGRPSVRTGVMRSETTYGTPSLR